MSNQSVSRRQFLRMGAMSSVGLALAACAAPAPGGAPATEAGAESAGPYQGDFVILSAGNPDQNAPLIEAIEAAHPGVKVVWRGLTSERYTELFAAAEIAGDQIDLMDLNGQDLRRYAVGGKLKDLTDVVTYQDRFREVGLRTYTINDKLWALPRGGVAGFIFFFNKKALETIGVDKDPETYQELLEWAPELKQAGYAPVTHSGKNIYLWPVWQFFAFGQTSGNEPVEKTWQILQGDAKFTDPESVAALEILHRYTQDEMFVDGVNSLETDGAWLSLSQGKASFWYHHMGQVATYRDGDFPELDMSLTRPLRSVDDDSIQRMLPGGTGSADGIYADIAPERLELAQSILDLMTSDEWVQWQNETFAQPVSTNQNVQASDDPLALKFAEECAPLQFTYLDWYWPPEITRAFQENEQAIVAGLKNPDEASQSIQDVLDELYADGYEFQS